MLAKELERPQNGSEVDLSSFARLLERNMPESFDRNSAWRSVGDFLLKIIYSLHSKNIFKLLLKTMPDDLP
jgi:hypothetical protein